MSNHSSVVVLNADCSSDREMSNAPDMFRINITPAVMEELGALKTYHRQMKMLYEARFPGKAFGNVEVEFTAFEADSAEGDDDVKRGLDNQAIRLVGDGMRLIAYMGGTDVKLVSERISFDLLAEKFAELRSMMTAGSVVDAIDAIPTQSAGTSKPRSSGGMSL